MNDEQMILIFKALSDSNRLQIIDMLSCGEMCACQILEHFNVTQPTLSHHMKVLCDINIVTVRKQGLWMYYRLNKDNLNDCISFIQKLMSDKENCICKRTNKNCNNMSHRLEEKNERNNNL